MKLLAMAKKWKEQKEQPASSANDQVEVKDEIIEEDEASKERVGDSDTDIEESTSSSSSSSDTSEDENNEV